MRPMKHTISWVFMAVLFLGLAQAVSAAPAMSDITPSEVKSLSFTEWQTAIDEAKAETSHLLEENKRLNTEYQLLREQLSGIQTDVMKVKDELDLQERENKKMETFRQDQLQVIDKIKADIEQARKTVGDLENEKLRMIQQLESEKKKTELWQTQLSELEVQKRELSLELKLQDISRQELERGQDDEIDQLKKELKGYQQKEQELDAKINTMKADNRNLVKEAESVAAKNKELEAQIARLEQQKAQQLRRNEVLSKERDSLAASAEVVPDDIVQEQRALEAQVAKLEAELEAIKISVQETSGVVQKKRQMMDEIMRLDKENQQLRSRIDELL